MQPFHPLAPLIMSCMSFMDRDWEIRFEHTFREGNRVVDKLANLGLSQSQGFHLIDSLPLYCNDVLYEDCMGYPSLE